MATRGGHKCELLIKVDLLKSNILKIIFFERFSQFLELKNDFENQNFEIFEEVVHNFGKSDDDLIY